MYSLVSRLENKVISTLNGDSELIDKVRLIIINKGDIEIDFSILGISDAKEYIEDNCDNLDLVLDSEVEKFLSEYGIEVEENEPDSYVDLMMDNHKCIEWKGTQYYVSDNLDLTDDEEKIYDVLVYSLHV